MLSIPSTKPCVSLVPPGITTRRLRGLTVQVARYGRHPVRDVRPLFFTQTCKKPALASALEKMGPPVGQEQEGGCSSVDFAIALAKMADDTKCQDIVVLHVAPLVSWTSYMVICSVFARPQLFALLARLEEMAKEKFEREVENRPGSSPWEILDFGDVVVQIFTPEQREFYNIEDFYVGAEEVELPFLENETPGDVAWTQEI